MKPSSPHEADDEILTQAAHWCLRLNDETCTVDERAAFGQWVQADPRHAFEYAKMLEIWDLSEALPNNPRTSKKLLTDPSSRQDGVREM
jgi:transmembrane sensor